MAKQAKEAATQELEREQTQLTTTAVDPDLERMIEADAGKGVSTSQADNLVPLIYILQPLSPQVLQGNAHIDGAHAGDIWLKNAPEPVTSGADGIWFQPCVMYQKWTEWVPRDKGGGFMGSYDFHGYDKLPAGAERDLKVTSRPRFWFPRSGHELIDTRYEAGLAWQHGDALPYVIPFKSTGHAVSRGWMTKRVNQRRKDGTIWPSWSFLYKLTTVQRQNNLGSWYVFEVGSPQSYLPGYKWDSSLGLKVVGGDYLRAYKMGQQLAAAFESGLKVHEEEDATVGAPDAGAGAPSGSSRREADDQIPF
jgi:hypothetical protein